MTNELSSLLLAEIVQPCLLMSQAVVDPGEQPGILCMPLVICSLPHAFEVERNAWNIIAMCPLNRAFALSLVVLACDGPRAMNDCGCLLTAQF